MQVEMNAKTTSPAEWPGVAHVMMTIGPYFAAEPLAK